MKTKTLIVLLLMILTLFSVTSINAESIIVGDTTFTMPEGYILDEDDGDQVVIKDNTTAITVYNGPIESTETAKQNRINAGYKLLGERTYDVDGVEVNQQNYNKDGINSWVYTFKKNYNTYIITFNLDENATIPEYEDNPVTEIINTLP